MVETMFSAGERTWHGKELLLEGKDTVDWKTALKASSTNWTVEKMPVYAKVDEGKFSPLPSSDVWALVRSKDHKVLSVVGSRYEPIQNEECARFMDDLLDAGDGQFVTGGSLFDGGLVFYCLKLPKSIRIGGMKDEKAEIYVTLANPHGPGLHGQGALRIVTSRVRVVCWNTMNAAWGASESNFRIRHTIGAKARIQQARESLKLVYEDTKQFKAEMEKLLEKKANNDTVLAVHDNIWPKPEQKTKTSDAEATNRAIARWKNRRNDWIQVYEKSPNIENVRDTHYGVYNAITEWAQYGRNFRGAGGDEEKQNELRFQEVTFGTAKEIGEQAFKQLQLLGPAKSTTATKVRAPRAKAATTATSTQTTTTTARKPAVRAKRVTTPTVRAKAPATKAVAKPRVKRVPKAK